MLTIFIPDAYSSIYITGTLKTNLFIIPHALIVKLFNVLLCRFDLKEKNKQI